MVAVITARFLHSHVRSAPHRGGPWISRTGRWRGSRRRERTAERRAPACAHDARRAPSRRHLLLAHPCSIARKSPPSSVRAYLPCRSVHTLRPTGRACVALCHVSFVCGAITGYRRGGADALVRGPTPKSEAGRTNPVTASRVTIARDAPVKALRDRRA